MELIKVQGRPMPLQGMCESKEETTRKNSAVERYAKWIAKFKDKHGDRYNYPIAVCNIRADVPMTITCLVHGEFTQMPLNHARGANCPKCAKEASYKSYATWIKDFEKVHGEIYEYPNAPAEIGSKVRLSITCKIHGVFYQIMDRHLQGDGCPACGNLSKRATYSEYLKKFEKVHRDKYIYPNNDPTWRPGTHTKLLIICRIHGEFLQSFNSHLSGSGCPNCFNENQTKTYSDWLHDFTRVHDDRYKYPSTISGQINAKTKIIITCKVHGGFQQSLDKHSQGKHCPKCACETNGLALTKNHENWLKDFKAIHGDRYEYPKEGIVGKGTKITIVCKEHGEFTQTPASHLRGCGCPTCFYRISKANLEIAEFIETLGIAVEKEVRIDGGKKYLFVDLKAGNLGIEHDGLYWHSSKFVQGEGDLPARRESMAKAELAMFAIFADEWLFKRGVVQHLLRERLSSSSVHIQATRLGETLSTEDRDLLAATHLGESCDGEVVRAIGFGGLRLAIAVFNRKTTCTAVLACYAENKRTQDGLRKCVTEYVKTHRDITRIEAFTDNRFNNDAIYTAVGFKKLYTTAPDYMYVVKSKRVHKSNFQKSKLAKMFPGEDMSLSEKEITEKHNIYRIYDCGKTKWELTL